MGVATTTDTTDSDRTSFEMLKSLYGMPVQVCDLNKNNKISGRFGSSQISSDLDSAGFGSVLGVWLGSSLS